MEKTILSISGKPGLYLLLSRGRSTVIVESVDAEKKRQSVGIRDKITSLNDISIYTDDGDVMLTKEFQTIADNTGCKPLDLEPKKMGSDKLAEFMAGVLPDYDRDRVYPGDIRKIIMWYNILVNNGYTAFADPEGEEAQQPSADETAGEAPEQ